MLGSRIVPPHFFENTASRFYCSPSSMTAPPPKSSSWNTGNIVVLLFVLFAFLGIGIISTLILGSVSGREFSPQSFCVREFSYLRIPGIHSRITSTNLSSTTGNLVCSTAISQHLTAGIGTNVRWDLVEFQIGSGTQTSLKPVFCCTISTLRMKETLGSNGRTTIPTMPSCFGLPSNLWPSIAVILRFPR